MELISVNEAREIVKEYKEQYIPRFLSDLNNLIRETASEGGSEYHIPVKEIPYMFRSKVCAAIIEKGFEVKLIEHKYEPSEPDYYRIMWYPE